ncbi:MAG: hypothetical protein Q4D55_11510, partial [Eubacteriales bacterium]|nr:hypothetical protein [Eubacteriales bacterium]
KKSPDCKRYEKKVILSGGAAGAGTVNLSRLTFWVGGGKIDGRLFSFKPGSLFPENLFHGSFCERSKRWESVERLCMRRRLKPWTGRSS